MARVHGDPSLKGPPLEHDRTHLTSVRILAAIGHTQQPRLRMLDVEILIGEFPAINAPCTRPVAVDKVAALDHERRDNSVAEKRLER